MHFLIKHKFFLIFIAILLLIFFIRIFFFVGNYGGIEHDSGWYLGVARNLAENGKYASFTNTIAVDGTGASPSIHGRYSVQDNQGYSYFPAGVTVGPGYVAPEALILKIFGSGWWQFRAWPLISFFALIFLLAFITFEIGGYVGAFIFFAWLWFVPQLTLQFAYEAYSEPTAFMFLIVSFLVYYLANAKKKTYCFLLSGVFLSFSFLTKNLYLLPGFTYFFLFLNLFIKSKQKKKLIFSFFLFSLGFIFPIILSESYRYYFLVSNFGLSAWEAVNRDILITFKGSGSGILNLDFFKLDKNLIFKKLEIWKSIGIENSMLFWFTLVLSIGVLLKLKIKRDFTKYAVLIILLSFAISFAWFIFISPMGWGRHIWQGLILGIVLVAASLGALVSRPFSRKKITLFLTIFLFLILNFKIEMMNSGLILNNKSIEEWKENRFNYSGQGFPSNPILSLKEQEELVGYFNKNIKKNDSVYYLGWFLNAEASAITGKVFFPLDRYLSSQKDNSYLILGPYQKGIWSFMPPDYVPLKKTLLCQDIVFENNSYTLCKLKKGLVYNNLPYQ